MVLLFTGVRGTRLRSAELSPLGTWRKHERAVGDAGPYGVRLSSCAGIRETADMDATVPLHDNRPARLRVVRGSGSDKRSTRDSLYDDQHIFWSSRGTRRRFMTRPAAQEVLKPAVSSRPFGHFWGCGQKWPALGARNIPAGGSDPSAAGGGYSEVSEWPRSKFQAPAVRQRRNFGHRSSVPFRT